MWRVKYDFQGVVRNGTWKIMHLMLKGDNRRFPMLFHSKEDMFPNNKKKLQ